MGVLEVKNAWLTYPGGVEALKGASLRVASGEVVAVLGPNGSGKTTLLLVAAGLLEPSRGEVLLDGRPLAAQLPGARRRIGLIFQEPDDQLFNPTVFEEIAFALRQLGTPEDEVEERVKFVARELGLEHLLDRSPYTLSAGEKRRVAIASVLTYGPEFLLFDEPTAYLSVPWRRALESLISRLRAEGKAVAVATHDVAFAARIADRVYLLKGGQVLAAGRARDLLSDERLLAEAGMEPPLPVKIYRRLVGDGEPPLTLEELIEALKSYYGRRALGAEELKVPRLA